MAPKRNLYATLGILRTCSDVEIRAAYKRRALETHPDKGGCHNSFLKVIQAFTALSDPVERAKYDANLKLRRDSDGTTLPPAAQPAAQAPAERCPKARKPAGPSSPPKPPKKVPTKRSPEAYASPAPEAPASEAKAIWQRWLDAPEEEWEEKFRSITYRMSSKVLEIGQLSFKVSKPGEAPKRKPGRKRLRSILDVPHKNSKTRWMQKYIRKVGSDKFHCIMCFRNLEVSTSSSHSLQETIDWHICLTRFQRMIEKTLDQGGDDDSYSEIPKALQSVLQDHLDQGGTAPHLTFSLRVYIKDYRLDGSRETHRLCRLFRTPDLVWVLQAHQKVCGLLQQGDRHAALEAMKQLREESISNSVQRKCRASREEHRAAVKAQQQREKAAKLLEDAKNEQRRRQLFQRLQAWQRTFKLRGVLPEGIDAARVDFGLGREWCCFATLDTDIQGPMRASVEEAAKDLAHLKRIHSLKGPELALQEAERLDAKAMLARFRRSLNIIWTSKKKDS